VITMSTYMNIIVENVRKRPTRFDIYKHGSLFKVAGLVIDKNIQWNGYFFSVIEFLDSLYHLSVIDKVKVSIYDAFKSILRVLIYDGNFTEKEYSLKLLWQLCFEKSIANSVTYDAKLIGYIKSIGQNEDMKKNANLIKYSDGIVWMTSQQSQSATLNQHKANAMKLEINASSMKHLMFSYNRETRDLCLSIKSDLEKLNFKTWIDVESDFDFLFNSFFLINSFKQFLILIANNLYTYLHFFFFC
jgi:hypothetical protein